MRNARGKITGWFWGGLAAWVIGGLLAFGAAMGWTTSEGAGTIGALGVVAGFPAMLVGVIGQGVRLGVNAANEDG